MTPGDKYLKAVSGFKGTDVKEQIRITLKAQQEFGVSWEESRKNTARAKQEIAANANKPKEK